ncbi:hypothetical protein [Neisseria sp. Ec49-e6-T10]|uniref:hypothetical protein n=1 Tax=Neisseria sp. Ec49-e6-T10 TaxID=3140744 RepID=UPI003EC063A5
MHILILGARAPACLEYARAFKQSQWHVTVADSLQRPLTRYSAAIDHFLYLPAPRYKLQEWTDTLIHYIQTNKVDLVLPMCEEVFYLSYQKPLLAKYTQVLVDEFELMRVLHHKGLFAQLVESWPIKAPETFILSDQTKLGLYKEQSEHFVFKPAFSRFASLTLVCPKAKLLDQIRIEAFNPCIVQKFIKGTEYCSYSILHQGKVTAHSCYQPTYRAGKGAGLYFVPQNIKAILDFVMYFGRKTRFTGQVAFDFIEDETGDFFVIECNPRGSSGVHLFFNQHQALVNALTHHSNALLTPNHQQALASKFAMVAVGLPKSLKKFRQWKIDFHMAKDIVFDPEDPKPSLNQYKSTYEALCLALKYKKSLWQAITEDIEWNGEFLV